MLNGTDDVDEDVNVEEVDETRLNEGAAIVDVDADAEDARVIVGTASAAGVRV